MKVAVVGLGSIGWAVAEYLRTQPGITVCGVEVNATRAGKAIAKIGIEVARSVQALDDIDFYSICLYTPESIIETCAAMPEVSRVVVESTVPMRLLGSKYLNRHRMAFFPHRWMEGDPEHGVRQARLFGCDQQDVLLFDDYLKSIGLRDVVQFVDKPVAVASKLTENAHRYMEIVLAQELKLACRGGNIQFEALRQAVNTKWNIDIKEARYGVGGHCLPKDMHWFIEAFPSHSLARVFRALNESYITREVDGKMDE